MFVELMAAHLVLKRWRQKFTATKMEIGVWQHWTQETEGNVRPLSEAEVNRMKELLRQNAPTSFFELFAEEETDR